MIKRNLPYDGILHEFVEHNGVLYIGGIVAEDTTQDMPQQAADVMRQLKKLLKAGGSDLSHVLQVTVYLAKLSERPDFNKVWKATFAAAHLPARATVGVADLGPGVKLELVATAAKKTAPKKK